MCFHLDFEIDKKRELVFLSPHFLEREERNHFREVLDSNYKKPIL
jgi:hypothetical protein